MVRTARHCHFRNSFSSPPGSRAPCGSARAWARSRLACVTGRAPRAHEHRRAGSVVLDHLWMSARGRRHHRQPGSIRSSADFEQGIVADPRSPARRCRGTRARCGCPRSRAARRRRRRRSVPWRGMLEDARCGRAERSSRSGCWRLSRAPVPGFSREPPSKPRQPRDRLQRHGGHAQPRMRGISCSWPQRHHLHHAPLSPVSSSICDTSTRVTPAL